jgi:hypothetical protein
VALVAATNTWTVLLQLTHHLRIRLLTATDSHGVTNLAVEEAEDEGYKDAL